MDKELFKNIALAIGATLLLVVVGVGSYFIANRVYPPPQIDNIQNVQNNQDQEDNVTLDTVKKLTPKSIISKIEGDKIVISWTTPLETDGNIVYITPDKNEKINQVLKDYFNGVKIAGIFKEEELSKAKTDHSITVDKSLVEDKNYKYFYIIVTYKKRRIPFGSKMDYTNQTGPTEPYEIILK